MISFILPIYDVTKSDFIRCFESIVTQDNFSDDELIIINDGSSNDCHLFIQKQIDGYDNCKYIFKKNGGVSSARNLGLKESKGEYIAFIDADDYLDIKFKRELINHKYYNYDLCIFSYFIDKGNSITSINCRDMKITKNIVYKEFNYYYSNCLFNPVWGRIFKRELIKKLFNEDVRYGEDLLFNLNYIDNCQNIYFIDLPIYHYVLNQNSVTNKYSRYAYRNYKIVLLFLIDYCIKHNIENRNSIYEVYIKNILGNFFLLCKDSLLKYKCVKDEIKEYSIELNEYDKSLIKDSPIRYRICMYLLNNHLYYLCFSLFRLMYRIKGIIRR